MSNQKSEPEPIVFIDTFQDGLFEVVEALVDGKYFDALCNIELRGRCCTFSFERDKLKLSFYTKMCVDLGTIQFVELIASDVSHFTGYYWLKIKTTCGIFEIHCDDEYI